MSDPTYGQFVRHAERFGAECVLETARVYLAEHELRDLDLQLCDLNGATRPRQRPTTGALTDQVYALADRGLVPAAIADTLNISDRRVRAILSGRDTRENGGRKRLEQAADFAAPVVGHLPGHPNGSGAEDGSSGLAGQLVLDLPEAPAA